MSLSTKVNRPGTGLEDLTESKRPAASTSSCRSILEVAVVDVDALPLHAIGGVGGSAEVAFAGDLKMEKNWSSLRWAESSVPSAALPPPPFLRGDLDGDGALRRLLSCFSVETAGSLVLGRFRRSTSSTTPKTR